MNSSADEGLDSLLASSPLLAIALAQAADVSRQAPGGNSPQEKMQKRLANELSGSDFRMMAEAANAVQEERGRKEIAYGDASNDFTNKGFLDALQNPSQYSGNTRHGKVNGLDGYRVRVNPEAHPFYLAHEMGHGMADQGQFGKAVRSAAMGTSFSDGTAKAIGRVMPSAGVGLAGALATLNPGEEDLAASIAAAYLGDSAKITDEIRATINSDAILRQRYGNTIPAGSRLRMAGNLGYYLAAPMFGGSAANYLGNLFDDAVVGPPANTANVA